MKPGSNNIEFFFDLISPYAFLASLELDRIHAESGISVLATPVLFAGLLKAHGTKGPAEVEAKRRYVFRDVERTAARLGIEAPGPPTHPFVPLLGLRACTSIESAIDRLAFAKALLWATWSRSLDPCSPATIVRLATECGLDGAQVAAAAQLQRVKDELRQNTKRAIGLGVFGVPTFVIGSELFWGADRITALIEHARVDVSRGTFRK